MSLAARKEPKDVKGVGREGKRMGGVEKGEGGFDGYLSIGVTEFLVTPLVVI